MALKNQETIVFYSNNKSVVSPTRSKPRVMKNNNFQTNSKAKMDYSEQNDRLIRARSGNGGSGIFVPSRGFSNKTRTAPSKERNPRLSPLQGEFYAGFTESPAPTAVPKPPSHWVIPLKMVSGGNFEGNKYLTQSVKTFLNIRAA
jgi:hypothetical protein